MLFVSRNLWTTPEPNVYPAPLHCISNMQRRRHRWRVTYRGDIAKSSFSGSGSDHTRSAMGPSCGISVQSFAVSQNRVLTC